MFFCWVRAGTFHRVLARFKPPIQTSNTKTQHVSDLFQQANKAEKATGPKEPHSLRHRGRLEVCCKLTGKAQIYRRTAVNYLPP